jgi:hypothetical protein
VCTTNSAILPPINPMVRHLSPSGSRQGKGIGKRQDTIRQREAFMS